MTCNRFHLLSMLLLFTCLGCEPAEFPLEEELPVVRLLEVKETSEQGVSLEAEVLSTGKLPIEDIRIQWGRKGQGAIIESPHLYESLGNTLAPGPLTFFLDRNFSPGHNYVAQMQVGSGDLNVYSNEISFPSQGSEWYPWRQLPDLPDQSNMRNIRDIFKKDGRVFVRNTVGRTWEYDPRNETWTQISGLSSGHLAFTFNDEPYFRIEDKYYTLNLNPISFELAGENILPLSTTANKIFSLTQVGPYLFICYQPNGESNMRSRIARFDPLTGEFTQIALSPTVVFDRCDESGCLRLIGHGSDLYYLHHQVFSFGADAHTRTYFYRLDLTTREWTELDDYPGQGTGYYLTISLENSLFIGMGLPSGSLDIWEFLPEEAEWRLLGWAPPTITRSQMTRSLKVDGKFYIFTNGSNFTPVADFHEFDPEKIYPIE